MNHWQNNAWWISRLARRCEIQFSRGGGKTEDSVLNVLGAVWCVGNMLRFNRSKLILKKSWCQLLKMHRLNGRICWCRILKDPTEQSDAPSEFET